MNSDSNPPLKITDDDLDRAVVGHLPVSRPTTPKPSFAPERPAMEGWNGPAVGAAIVAAFAALLAVTLAVLNAEAPGAALFGLAVGLGAVVLGCVALARPARARLRGTGLAVGGIVVGIAGAAGCLVIITESARPDANFAAAAFEPDPEALRKLAPPLQRAMKANVLVEGRSGWKGLGAQTIGSGVILRISGGQAYVVTNRHVVDHGFTEGASGSHGITAGGPFKIKLIGQSPQPASVVWVAPDGIDLAIASVAILSDDPQSAEWIDDPEAKIGDEVFAVGNPHGLGWTHTTGAISQFRQQNSRGRTIRVIQTNTAINPGNSGGGLYDKQGRLVGITTWTQDKRVAEGLSFAIAFETLLKLNPDVLNLADGKSP
jgi:multisubunit Na+/H+ antiporter MnhB subunit